MSQSDIQAIIERIKFLDIQEEQGRKEKRKLLEELEKKSGPRQSKAPTLQAGDRVKVLNKVIRPDGAPNTWDKAAEKLAVVRFANEKSDRVAITTDNGTKTWRLRKNVKKI